MDSFPIAALLVQRTGRETIGVLIKPDDLAGLDRPVETLTRLLSTLVWHIQYSIYQEIYTDHRGVKVFLESDVPRENFIRRCSNPFPTRMGVSSTFTAALINTETIIIPAIVRLRLRRGAGAGDPRQGISQRARADGG